jgi:hypothetical protein
MLVNQNRVLLVIIAVAVGCLVNMPQMKLKDPMMKAGVFAVCLYVAYWFLNSQGLVEALSKGTFCPPEKKFGTYYNEKTKTWSNHWNKIPNNTEPETRLTWGGMKAWEYPAAPGVPQTSAGMAVGTGRCGNRLIDPSPAWDKLGNPRSGVCWDGGKCCREKQKANTWDFVREVTPSGDAFGRLGGWAKGTKPRTCEEGDKGQPEMIWSAHRAATPAP